MRLVLLAPLLVALFACGRDGPYRAEPDAGGDAGVADGGSDGGAALDAGEFSDAGETFATTVLFEGDDVLAVALEPRDEGFLLAWVETSPFTYRITALALDERGERTNLDQVVYEQPSAALVRQASMLPGALRRVGPDRWRLTALVGDAVVQLELDQHGFRQGAVRTFPAPDDAWALEGASHTLERHTDGRTSFLDASGTRAMGPATAHDGDAVGAASENGFLLLTTDATGALALEALASPAATAWSSTSVAQAPAGTVAGLLDPWAKPLALRPLGDRWVTAWAERTPTNPRTVDVRVAVTGSAPLRIEGGAAWYEARADLAVTSGGWALAWTAMGIGWNDRVKFLREGASAPCELQTTSGTNHSAGPLALATRPGGRLGALWVEPQHGQPSEPRNARLVFRSLGTRFCAP